jgi:hypothetical protein
MKKTNYCVWFLYGGNTCISAFSATEAAILACAERIYNARSIEIQSIENLDTDEIEISFPCKLALVEKE